MSITRITTSIILGCGIVSISSSAHNWLAQCDIAFANQFALSNVYVQARATFASYTRLSPGGQLELCDPAKHGGCWTYRERCGLRGYVNVEEKPRIVKRKVPTNQQGVYKIVLAELYYGHFHLTFEDPTLTRFAAGADGLGAGFGRQMGNTCVPADWKSEPRTASTHDSDETLRVWVEDSGTHSPRIFDVASINIRGTVAAQVWFN